mmetsp:Transcript_76161/g.202355  ORF Transcript_76161/g.202355 Transcript_76161/m.202355 type:complete len:103 (+) Transcript_76161:2-310(+)
MAALGAGCYVSRSRRRHWKLWSQRPNWRRLSILRPSILRHTEPTVHTETVSVDAVAPPAADSAALAAGEAACVGEAGTELPCAASNPPEEVQTSQQQPPQRI